MKQEMDITTLQIFFMHYPSDNGGLTKGMSGTIRDTNSLIQDEVEWKEKTITFPNGSTFTITEDPVKGDVSLTGKLSGDIPNGLTNYREAYYYLKRRQLERCISCGNSILL